jgi:hydrogenase maturation factor
MYGMLTCYEWYVFLNRTDTFPCEVRVTDWIHRNDPQFLPYLLAWCILSKNAGQGLCPLPANKGKEAKKGKKKGKKDDDDGDDDDDNNDNNDNDSGGEGDDDDQAPPPAKKTKKSKKDDKGAGKGAGKGKGKGKGSSNKGRSKGPHNRLTSRLDNSWEYLIDGIRWSNVTIVWNDSLRIVDNEDTGVTTYYGIAAAAAACCHIVLHCIALDYNVMIMCTVMVTRRVVSCRVIGCVYGNTELEGEYVYIKVGSANNKIQYDLFKNEITAYRSMLHLQGKRRERE